MGRKRNDKMAMSYKKWSAIQELSSVRERRVKDFIKSYKKKKKKKRKKKKK